MEGGYGRRAVLPAAACVPLLEEKDPDRCLLGERWERGGEGREAEARLWAAEREAMLVAWAEEKSSE
jgi:hypothetical protein